MLTRFSSRGPALAIVFALASTRVAAAHTYVVDQSGGAGSDFTDLPPAIAAAAPGDVLLVRPGHYSDFVLDKQLAILGQGPGVVVHSPPFASHSQLVGITGDPSLVQGRRPFLQGRPTALLGMQVGLEITNCSGPIVLEDCQGTLSILGCRDVRGRRLASVAPIVVQTSRLEITESTLVGGSGYSDCISHGGPTDGATGIVAIDGEVHVARCDLSGGDGGDNTCPEVDEGDPPGDGGDGLRLLGVSTGLVTGSSANLLRGGVGGSPGGSGFPSGSPGFGVRVGFSTASALRYSGATILGIAAPPPGVVDHPATDDPTLRLTGTPNPGSELTFAVSAPPGAAVRLRLGASPVRVDAPGLGEDVLALGHRVFDLGVVPPGGSSAGLHFVAPASWERGMVPVFQGEVTLPGGEIRRTNSVPLIVR